MSEVFWMQTTIGASLVAFIAIIICLSLWMFMKPEGRFFFKRSFDNKGIDVLRHEPLSNRLTPIVVKWNGRHFEYGKEMIFFGIESLLNPIKDPQKYFNEVLSRMCHWAGSRRPVLVATDVCSHIATPELLALMAKAKKHDTYKAADKKVTAFIDYIEKTLEPEDKFTTITYLETISPNDLTQFLEDVGARDAKQAFNLGKRVNELERNKGLDLGAAGKIVISLAAVGVVLLIIYLVATGKFQEIISTVK